MRFDIEYVWLYKKEKEKWIILIQIEKWKRNDDFDLVLLSVEFHNNNGCENHIFVNDFPFWLKEIAWKDRRVLFLGKKAME